MKDDLTGYLLAGGKSSRMGTDKAFLETGGETLLARAVRVLRPHCSRVKIVLNRSQTHFIERLPPDSEHIFDIFENRGAPGGIHAALHDCATRFAVILAVDLPFVTSEAIGKLAEISLSGDFSANVPCQPDGRRQPLCAVYRVPDCRPEIEKLLRQETSPSVRDFLESLRVRLVEQSELTVDKTTDLFFNLNNPADFRQISNPLPGKN